MNDAVGNMYVWCDNFGAVNVIGATQFGDFEWSAIRCCEHGNVDEF